MYLAIEGARVRDRIGGSAPAPRGSAIPNRNEQFGFGGDPPSGGFIRGFSRGPERQPSWFGSGHGQLVVENEVRSIQGGFVVGGRDHDVESSAGGEHLCSEDLVGTGGQAAVSIDSIVTREDTANGLRDEADRLARKVLVARYSDSGHILPALTRLQ